VAPLARRSKDVNQSRRLLSLAAVRDGMDRGSAAKIGGMDRQTLRDWVHRFNRSGPEGLIDNWTEGPKPRLSEEQLTQFAQIVEGGPDREKDGVVRWRRIDLKRVIAERFGVDFHPRYVGKLLHKLGFSHMSARPRHPAQDERIVEAFKKISRARWKLISKGCRRRRRSRYGLRMRPGLARRMGRFGSGPGVERGQGSPPTSAMTTPICSARSAPPAGSARPLPCPMPTPT
jgi:transposase